MADDSRFRRLEKPRTGKDGRSTPLSSPGRFEGTPPTSAQRDDEPAAQRDEEPAAPRAGLDRFREGPRQPMGSSIPPPPRSLEAFSKLEPVPTAEPEPADSQPFVRCALCETDASRFAKRCPNCGTLLDTPDQRVFNDRLWSQRLAEKKQSDQEVSELRRRGAAAGLSADEQRRLGEQLAREVFEREHARLGWMDEVPRSDLHARPGLRLLRLIPSLKLQAVVACLLVFLGCYFAWSLFREGPMLGRVPALAFFAAAFALFGPGRGRRRTDWPD